MSENKIHVWDRIVRIGHWVLALAFGVAYLSAESERWRLVHVISGGLVFASVAIRIVWGLFGTKYAKFSTFLAAPMQAVGYLKGLLSGKPQHYIGHNPAGGWAVIGLLGLSLLATVTGWLTYNEIGGIAWDELHETLGNATLVMVVLHIAFVLITSHIYKENLPRSMVNGNRHGPAQQGIQDIAWYWVIVYLAVLSAIAYAVVHYPA